MEQKATSKAEVIMAGLGGMGVLVAGQVVSWAALQRYKHVSWAPSYAVARRGGLCECTVIFSDEEIASPLLDQAQTVIVFDGSQMKAFESRVRAGGVMIVEKAGLTDTPERGDFTLLPVPGMEIAISLGESLINNLILLGVYVKTDRVIPCELIERELERRYGSKEKILERNKTAFRHGLELGKTIKG